MTVKELVEKLGLEVIVAGPMEVEISGVYVGDLLSNVGQAEERKSLDNHPGPSECSGCGQPDRCSRCNRSGGLCRRGRGHRESQGKECNYFKDTADGL